ncbi:uncharacterized protein Gasu_03860 [Galdieria sulphuraria]|uniref:Uncharacterized protein n=1 Tax=Galdieria sulphuraria TaxID=130081 RepID=M2Y945_GALSU|nr:uncharacterized protein Gasu_03860 [Galdieria sulphuraria]EME32618.1 hypothetical protein Gasu_03860 [Galdieria sulphuraria]|eukprot:XP_005709138.1 hypothetical protein Gasu_03860 [Galdieria sulphuraria]
MLEPFVTAITPDIIQSFKGTVNAVSDTVQSNETMGACATYFKRTIQRRQKISSICSFKGITSASSSQVVKTLSSGVELNSQLASF